MNKTLMAAGLSVILGACSSSKKSDVAEGATPNPFFAEYTTPFGVPPFDQIEVAHYKPALLKGMEEHSKEIETTYGKVSSQSVGAILRALIAIEDQGGDTFFGEPNLDLNDWFATDENGQGYVNVLNAARLINSPQIYAMFLLWMLSELFETLPEVGDGDKPKFVFFFDEAHLLFNGMPKELLDKIVQVVKLIRSKGVGVYFITQSPSDIPDEVLAQLSNRIQHGLRAYTPAEQKAVKAAAQSFRENPAFNAKDKILELGTGEALVSFLDEEGKPCIVEYAKILPPQCRMAAADPEVIDRVLAAQETLMSKYGEAIDRESAYELISKQAEALDEEAKQAAEQAQADIEAAEAEKRKAKEAEKAAAAEEKRAQKAQQEAVKQVGSVLGQIGREASRQIIRGIFGALKK